MYSNTSYLRRHAHPIRAFVDSSQSACEVHMRSGLIFNVSAKFTNRYLLCRMLSASARKMHRDGVSASQCINNSLRALRDGKPVEKPGMAAVTETVEFEAKETERLAP